jgi:hypothetical protein
LIRPQAENTRPPRALWVPFELGRPFGPPTDPTFQRRVIVAALRLLEREDGPVVIEDFEDDDPRGEPDPAWRQPVLPTSAVGGFVHSLADRPEAEIVNCRPLNAFGLRKTAARRSGSAGWRSANAPVMSLIGCAARRRQACAKGFRRR